MREIGTLIINPRGDEKKIYPPHYIPETPPENTIIFPDKKEVHIDWRRNLSKLTEISALIEEAEVVQEEGIYRVPMDRPDIPFAIGLIFSDAHIGSFTTDHELIRDLLDTVMATPNTFLVDAGDTFDNGIWGGLQYEQSLPPYMQQFTVSDIMREMGDKYGACVIGNHAEWMFTAVGHKPEQVFAQRMKGPVFAGMGLLHLKAGEQEYDMAIAHNYWGKSKKNIWNCCVNFRNHEYPDADIFVVGHEHIWGHAKERVDNKGRLYIRPGTAKLRDRYARIHGIARRGQACGIAVVLGTKDRSLEAYSLDDAVQLMAVREKIAEYNS